MSSIKYIDEIITYNTEKELFDLLSNTDYDVRILGSDYEGKSFTGSDLGKPIHYHSREHLLLARPLSRTFSNLSKIKKF
jgi:hypothetical protein